MSDWPALTRELDAWAAAGRVATLWWRDDDAAAPCPALDRLLDLAAAYGMPLALAVIPARATDGLGPRLAGAPAAPAILQHGFAHRNHTPDADKKCELGAHRPAADVLEELARGQARMDELFGQGWLPVMVPPWNRIAPAIARGLPGLGFRGLSTHGARAAAHPAPGLLQVNTHVDIMRWPAPRGFLGEAAALALLIEHLRARRHGEVDAGEPTGLLTHHLAHDAGCWAFLARLLACLSAHPGAGALTATEVFAPAAGVDEGVA